MRKTEALCGNGGRYGIPISPILSNPEANSRFDDAEPDPLLNNMQVAELLQTHHKAFTEVRATQQFAEMRIRKLLAFRDSDFNAGLNATKIRHRSIIKVKSMHRTERNTIKVYGSR